MKDLTGLPVGYLKVIRLVGKDKWGYNLWECKCVCGKITQVRSSSLLHQRTKSCGCKMGILQKDNPRSTTHGQAKIRNGKRLSSVYNSYNGAEQRCNNLKNIAYKDYGGRGIKFLFTSFEQFFAELGPRPEGKTVDRINNDGNYEPGNVRWATWEEQGYNKRFKGKGYYWEENSQRWRVKALYKGKYFYAGRHRNEKDAKNAAENLRAKLVEDGAQC